MSTVTLSKPHCAITSAENPDGIASQPFTTALPAAQTFLTLFVVIDRVSFVIVIRSGRIIVRQTALSHAGFHGRLDGTLSEKSRACLCLSRLRAAIAMICLP